MNLRRWFVFGPVLILVVWIGGPAVGQVAFKQSGTDLSERAFQLLKSKCHQCHGVERQAGLLVLNRRNLVEDRGSDLDRFVEVNKPEKSLLWTVIETDYMPYKPQIALTPAEKQIIKEWIANGAEFPKPKPANRQVLSHLDILKAIEAHLVKLPANGVRTSTKFFSLAHLHNNLSGSVQDIDLRVTRAALTKALNSLCRSAGIVHMQSVDGTFDTVYAIDINDLGWTAQQWRSVLKRYPYGFKPRDLDTLEAYQRVEKLIGAASFDKVIPVRADWFVATATDGSSVDDSNVSLYDILLEIPTNLATLEADLQVTRNDDIVKLSKNAAGQFQVVRGGVLKSGVSSQNRVIDVFQARKGNGWYWISYDFERGAAKGNIVTHPLGPDFDNHPFKGRDVAFSAAGGEVIFPLPNGLHGYMLVNGKGERIPEGPTTIVSDQLKTAGTPQIANGLSCFACHTKGMVPFDDVIGEDNALQNVDEQQFARSLFNGAKLKSRMGQTSQEYLKALRAVVEPHFKDAAFQDKEGQVDLNKIPEPISAVARRYQEDLDLPAVAAEIGVSEDRLRGAVENTRELARLGFQLLLKPQGTIKRTMLTTTEANVTNMHEALSILKIGDSITVR